MTARCRFLHLRAALRSPRGSRRSPCGRPSTFARVSRRSIQGARSSCSASRRRATRCRSGRSPTLEARGSSSRSSRWRWPMDGRISPSTRSRMFRWTCRLGFVLAAICEREDPRDALVSNHYLALEGLPGGARIGTSSLRREAQLRERDALLQVLPLRGNVDTRLRKLDEGRYDAIVLAAAGLKRLGFASRIASHARSRARACRPRDKGRSPSSAARTAMMSWPHSHRSPMRARRSRPPPSGRLRARCRGDCRTPLAAYAMPLHDELWLRGLVASRDGGEGVARRAKRGGRRRSGSRGARRCARREFLARGAARVCSRDAPDSPWRLPERWPTSASWSRDRRGRPARSRRSSPRSVRRRSSFLRSRSCRRPIPRRSRARTRRSIATTSRCSCRPTPSNTARPTRDAGPRR